MAKATYVQKGESLNYKNVAAKTIEAGDVVEMVARIGIAGCNIAPGETGTVHVIGVFRIPKSGADEIPVGTPVFFDGRGITNAQNDGNEGSPVSYTPAGYAAELTAAGAADILIKLPG